MKSLCTLVSFGHKLWVEATPPRYAIHFYPCSGKDGNYDKERGIRGSVVISLVSKLSAIPSSSYHAVMENVFTSQNFLRLLKSKGISSIGRVRAKRT